MNIFWNRKIWVCYIFVTVSRFVSDKKKGSCDLFPTTVRPFPNGVWLFRGKFGFYGSARGTRVVRTKTQLAYHQTKERGYTKMC